MNDLKRDLGIAVPPRVAGIFYFQSKPPHHVRHHPRREEHEVILAEVLYLVLKHENS